jgi:hypothetical protein
VFKDKQVKEVLDKLQDASDNIEYGLSEVYSAESNLSSIEGLDEVSSAKDYVSQAESYLYEAKDQMVELQTMIKTIGALS